mgnify:CR=1 FL=1
MLAQRERTATTMNNLRQTDDGVGFHYENGFCVIHNPGSGQLCNPGGLSAWIEARERDSASHRKEQRAEDAKAIRTQRAEDIRVLGPLYGELATLIRKNMAAAKKAVGKSVVPKRNKRRRRNIKDN